jgi:sensor histidine kinase regulating citrate/malate metabolism
MKEKIKEYIKSTNKDYLQVINEECIRVAHPLTEEVVEVLIKDIQFNVDTNEVKYIEGITTDTGDTIKVFWNWIVEDDKERVIEMF